jgi:hypothetical protein
MFADGFFDIPDAINPFGECDKIAFDDVDFFTVACFDDDFALDEIARFLLVVKPAETRYFLAPNGPGVNPESLQHIFSWSLNLDFHIFPPKDSLACYPNLTKKVEIILPTKARTILQRLPKIMRIKNILKIVLDMEWF